MADYNSFRLLEFSRLAQNALPRDDAGFKTGLADIPDCHRCDYGLEETVEHAFLHCPLVSPFWDQVEDLKARVDPEYLVSTDLALTLPRRSGMKRSAFLTLITMARIMVCVL